MKNKRINSFFRGYKREAPHEDVNRLNSTSWDILEEPFLKLSTWTFYYWWR